MLTSRKVRMRTEGTKRAGRYMSHTQASVRLTSTQAGEESDRTRHLDGVGQVEATLGLHHVGEQGKDGPVLLDQGQLDLRLVPLEILFTHALPRPLRYFTHGVTTSTVPPRPLGPHARAPADACGARARQPPKAPSGPVPDAAPAPPPGQGRAVRRSLILAAFPWRSRR